ncbi:MAG: asparaginase domain-containing protein [Moraxella osloensis]
MLTGTDTLSYLAAFLAESFAGSHISIVVTGAMRLCLIAMC